MKTRSKPKRGVHEMHRETVGDRPIDEAFAFFSDARNLERLTPGFLRSEVRSARPIDMRAGAEIDYALCLRGLPLRWRSWITVWEPPHRFVDEQVRSPYRSWRHEHRFEGGTRCADTFAMPTGAAGSSSGCSFGRTSSGSSISASGRSERSSRRDGQSGRLGG